MILADIIDAWIIEKGYLLDNTWGYLGATEKHVEVYDSSKFSKFFYMGEYKIVDILDCHDPDFFTKLENWLFSIKAWSK